MVGHTIFSLGVPDNKTTPTNQSPEAMLNAMVDSARRHDGLTLMKLCASATDESPVMWGPSIIGFGVHHYVHPSGRSGTTPAIGFAMRSKNIAVYGVHEAAEENSQLLLQLGPHTTGKGCLYLGSVDQIDQRVLKLLLTQAFKKRRNSS